MVEIRGLKIFFDEGAVGGPSHTQRQVDLIEGKVEPVNNTEWEYAQEHSSDILPKAGDNNSSSSDTKPAPDLQPTDYTHAGHTHRGLGLDD